MPFNCHLATSHVFDWNTVILVPIPVRDQAEDSSKRRYSTERWIAWDQLWKSVVGREIVFVKSEMFMCRFDHTRFGRCGGREW